MALLRLFFGLVITVCVCIIAVSNTNDVSVIYNPIFEPVNVPLYVVILASMVAGFVLGGLLVWLNMSNLRRDRRRQRKEIQILEREVGKLKENRFAAPEAPAADLFPALASK